MLGSSSNTLKKKLYMPFKNISDKADIFKQLCCQGNSKITPLARTRTKTWVLFLTPSLTSLKLSHLQGSGKSQRLQIQCILHITKSFLHISFFQVQLHCVKTYSSLTYKHFLSFNNLMPTARQQPNESIKTFIANIFFPQCY